MGGSDLLNFVNQRTTSGRKDSIRSFADGFAFSLEDQSNKLSKESLLGAIEGAEGVSGEVATAKNEAVNLHFDDLRAKNALEEEKKQREKSLFSSLLSTAVTGGLSGLFGGSGGAKAITTSKASGGAIMAMGGEYLMSPEATKNYGTEFFDSLNSGSIPKRSSGGSSIGSSGSIGGGDEIKDLTREIKNNGLGKTEINITIDSSGGSTTEFSSTSSDEKAQESRDLSRLIEAKVQEALIEDRRSGKR